VFSGTKANYTITTAGGVVTVVDNRSGSPDGTDTITGVEQLRFSDQVVNLGGTGTAPPTSLVGGSGNDTLTGGASADEIYGRSGNDTLSGMGGNDKLFGENGDDRLDGGLGDDVLDGGAGKDALKGGDGADSLRGGMNPDTLDGGTGADDFVFTAVSDSLPGALDTIVGFAKGEDDMVVSAIDANASLAGDQAFVLDAGGTFASGEIRQRVSNGNLIVEFNTDADTTVEMAVLLRGVTSPLAAGDFDL
jgi:Ca2+-binding RTX toxin-like protein